MDDKEQYINTLKSLATSKVKKIKVERQEQVLMEMDKKDKDLRVQLIKWFLENPYPNDKQVHAYAEKIGMDEHELEGHIYSIISSVLSEGKSKGKEVKHDPKQLEMGIKVEMEHTSCPTISRKIALDHLAEIPDYYTRLDKMEKEAGVEHHD
jgi:hypothetical protein